MQPDYVKIMIVQIRFQRRKTNRTKLRQAHRSGKEEQQSKMSLEQADYTASDIETFEAVSE